MSEKKERPILFNGAMVRAILDGRTTVTRRLVKPQYIGEDWSVRPAMAPRSAGHSHDWWLPTGEQPYTALPNCPFGQPGDRLWVRENWMDLRGTGVEHRPTPDSPLQRYAYGADSQLGSASDEARKDFGLKWRPSIHMPRTACRIMLEITDVRVERLQDITEDQARAEGAEPYDVEHATEDELVLLDAPLKEPGNPYRNGFALLWNSTGGDWDANPWVWVIEFERVVPHGV
jgi:hypothetical protein